MTVVEPRASTPASGGMAGRNQPAAAAIMPAAITRAMRARS
jgi:hypothetical protein